VRDRRGEKARKLIKVSNQKTPSCSGILLSTYLHYGYNERFVKGQIQCEGRMTP
jgi:hypothetical protein